MYVDDKQKEKKKKKRMVVKTYFTNPASKTVLVDVVLECGGSVPKPKMVQQMMRASKPILNTPKSKLTSLQDGLFSNDLTSATN